MDDRNSRTYSWKQSQENVAMDNFGDIAGEEVVALKLQVVLDSPNAICCTWSNQYQMVKIL